jgi:hypothetical protein
VQGRAYSSLCIFMRRHKMGASEHRVQARRDHPRASGGRFMQDPENGLRRIALPRTRANKEKFIVNSLSSA